MEQPATALHTPFCLPGAVRYSCWAQIVAGDASHLVEHMVDARPGLEHACGGAKLSLSWLVMSTTVGR